MTTILITGISRGIGRAIALRFLDEGYFVIGTSTSGEVDFTSDNLIVYQLDLSKSKSIKDCADKIISANKKIDILINNAGVALDIEKEEMDILDLRQTIEINLIGTIDFTEQIIPTMNIGGHILNTSSSAGSLSRTIESDDWSYPAYRISKTAINMYTRTFAIRLKDKILVSSYHPGWVKTDMGGTDADMTPEEASSYAFGLATKGFGTIETGQFWFKGEKFAW